MDLLDLTHQITAALGAGWVAERGQPHRAHVLLHGPDEQRLSVTDGDDSHRRSDHGRLHIRADYHQYGSDLGTGEGDNTITVSAHRTATAIATDISRRLLPDYQATLARCRPRAHAHTIRLTQPDATIDTLCRVLAPTEVLPPGDRISFGESGDGVRGQIRVLYSGATEFELDVTAAHTIQLARVIAAHRRTRQEQQ
ncbi:hypothetical protein ACIBJI_34755 [Nocardia sp. NPDC050408]|uniref:hypothetical protein n=1 Tax=Nocardia sp. NPDC050408 TaxID=3364319 RepID=UPI0037BAB0F6